VIMELNDYVLANQNVRRMVRDRIPGDTQLDLYYGTLDYATARFDTILLKLSQDRLLEQEHRLELHECYEAIQSFHRNVVRYKWWPKLFRYIVAMVLHGIGTRRIPKIKRLLKTLDN